MNVLQRRRLSFLFFVLRRGPGLAITLLTHAVCFRLFYLRPFFE